MGGGPGPLISSWRNTERCETSDYETGEFLGSSFFYITPEEKVYFAESPKRMKEVTLEECNRLLEPVEDEELFPPVPTGVELTIAPKHLDDESAFVKYPRLFSYNTNRGTDFISTNTLDETLIMETLHENPHPNIVKYYGCRVRDGRITSILMERLELTLDRYASSPAFRDVDKDEFCRGVDSAVAHLHSLGLAHNDISSLNIMVRNAKPVLIDFGSCQPVGNVLQSLGSPGWCEEDFFTSEYKHDLYSLKRLREWFDEQKESQEPEKPQIPQQAKGLSEQPNVLIGRVSPSTVAA